MLKLGVLVLLGLTAVALSENCPENVPKGTLWPLSTDCRSYINCDTGKQEECSWFLRKFNRETLKCDWYWKVDCTASPVAPTNAPVPAATKAAPAKVPPV